MGWPTHNTIASNTFLFSVLFFYNINDDELKCIDSVLDDNIYHLYEQCSTLNFKSYSISEYNRGVISKMKLTLAITSIAIVIQNVKTIYLNSEKIRIGLSFLHFNYQNIITNLDKIKDYTYARTHARTHELGILFDIITISEIWLKSLVIVPLYIAWIYSYIHQNWKNKKGSGVAIYVKESI